MDNKCRYVFLHLIDSVLVPNDQQQSKLINNAVIVIIITSITGATVPGDGIPPPHPVRRPAGGEHPRDGARGAGGVEGPAGRLGWTASAAGGHGGEVPLLHHGEGPTGLDGEHHPADRDTGEAAVSPPARSLHPFQHKLRP